MTIVSFVVFFVTHTEPQKVVGKVTHDHIYYLEHINTQHISHIYVWNEIPNRPNDLWPWPPRAASEPKTTHSLSKKHQAKNTMKKIAPDRGNREIINRRSSLSSSSHNPFAHILATIVPWQCLGGESIYFDWRARIRQPERAPSPAMQRGMS